MGFGAGEGEEEGEDGWVDICMAGWIIVSGGKRGM